MEQKQNTVTNEAAKSGDAVALQKPERQPEAEMEPGHLFMDRLHAMAGNRHAGRWLQAKLKVGQANDAFEQEADRAADTVMRMADPALEGSTAPPVVQRKCSQCEEEESGDLQRKESGTAPHTAPAIVHETLNSAGHPLDAGTRAFMEPRFGYDFSQVRVRVGAQAAAAAQAVRAKAFTVGPDVVFGAGEYSPGTPGGQRLLAHELAHVVQQSGQRRMLQRAETDTSSNCAPLTDSEQDVNDKVNAALANARKAAGPSPTGIDVAKGVVKELATDTSLGRTAIEDWASTLPATKQDLPAQSATKYAGVSYRLWAQTSFPILNPTMKIHSICVGSDKLGHFFQQGAEFFSRESLLGTAVAEEKSERSEGGGFGLSATGVFSNADREANRKGGKFYADLIKAPMMTFSIASYISSAWNEEDHPSFYEESVGKQVWANVLTGNWAGHSFDKSPFADNPLTANLTATLTGKITGTFTVGGITGKITGTINYQTTKVRGTDLFGSDVDKTPISGITIDFDWTLGSASGKGALHSLGERELAGTWGNGKSTDDRGSWLIDHK